MLRGHTDDVYSVMKLNETTIVSGSGDNTLRVWDLTNDTSRVLNGHTKFCLVGDKIERDHDCQWKLVIIPCGCGI